MTDVSNPQIGGIPATPAARWRESGDPDPHGDRYACERAGLDGGDMSDDEVAFLIGSATRGDLDIGWKHDIAKDRIRWLSRALVASEADRDALLAENRRLRDLLGDPEGTIAHTDGIIDAPEGNLKAVYDLGRTAMLADATDAVTSIIGIRTWDRVEKGIYLGRPEPDASSPVERSFDDGVREALAAIVDLPASSVPLGPDIMLIDPDGEVGAILVAFMNLTVAMISDAEEYAFVYRNWRGEVGRRRVRPISLRFSASAWHQKPQWLMLGLDLDKNENREFAMSNIVPADQPSNGDHAVARKRMMVRTITGDSHDDGRDAAGSREVRAPNSSYDEGKAGDSHD